MIAARGWRRAWGYAKSLARKKRDVLAKMVANVHSFSGESYYAETAGYVKATRFGDLFPRIIAGFYVIGAYYEIYWEDDTKAVVTYEFWGFTVFGDQLSALAGKTLYIDDQALSIDSAEWSGLSGGDTYYEWYDLTGLPVFEKGKCYRLRIE